MLSGPLGPPNPWISCTRRALARGSRRGALHAALDLRVPRIQRCAEKGGAGDCHKADERCEECVLDKILPLFVTNEAKCEGIQSGHCVISQITGTSSDLATPATTPDRATEPLVSINRQLTIPIPRYPRDISAGAPDNVRPRSSESE